MTHHEQQMKRAFSLESPRQHRQQREQEPPTPPKSSKSRYAFVTLLYGHFDLGARVLGRSIDLYASNNNSNTKVIINDNAKGYPSYRPDTILPLDPPPDKVILTTPDVPATTLSTLKSEGWRVHPVPAIKNPNAGYAARLSGVYAKLLMYTELHSLYDRLLFLDADCQLLQNVDELFRCGPFCAVMRHSELLNSGVLVVEPSKEVYEDMKGQFGELYSYTGGDQGFLNSYYGISVNSGGVDGQHPSDPRQETFGGFADCGFFEPYYGIGESQPGDYDRYQLSNEKKIGDPVKKCMRLPQRYNGDWPMALLNGGLEMIRVNNPPMPPEFRSTKLVKILHYTLGVAKPWIWWTRALIPMVFFWTDVAVLLENPTTVSEVGENFLDVNKKTRGYGGWKDWRTAIFRSVLPIALGALLISSLLLDGRIPNSTSSSSKSSTPSFYSSDLYCSGSKYTKKGSSRYMIFHTSGLFAFLIPMRKFIGFVFGTVSSWAIILPPFKNAPLTCAINTAANTSNTHLMLPVSSSATILANLLTGLAFLFISFGWGISAVKPAVIAPAPGWAIFFSHAFVVWFTLSAVWMSRWYDAGCNQLQNCQHSPATIPQSIPNSHSIPGRNANAQDKNTAMSTLSTQQDSQEEEQFDPLLDAAAAIHKSCTPSQNDLDAKQRQLAISQAKRTSFFFAIFISLFFISYIIHMHSLRAHGWGDMIPSFLFGGIVIVGSVLVSAVRLPTVWYVAGLGGGVNGIEHPGERLY